MLAWFITSTQSHQQNLIKFEYEASQITRLIQERMSHYEVALRSGVAAIHSNELQVDLFKWRKFSETLSIEERYPGINGIGVIYQLTQDELTPFLNEIKKERSDFKIHPTHELNEYWPITYVEPIEGNEQAIGLDMAHESNRLSAAKKARDSGGVQITSPIILVQDAKHTPGFLFYIPYYKEISVPSSIEERRRTFIGLVYAPFIVEKLIKGALQHKDRLVNFRITENQSVLYDEFTPVSDNYDVNAEYSKNINIEMYGKNWLFEIQTTKLFKEQQVNNLPMVILLSGIVIDLLLLIVFYIFASTNKKATELANKMMVLGKSKERELLLQQYALDEHAIVSKTDVYGNITYVNEKFIEISGYTNEELIGQNHRIINSGYHDKEFFKEMYKNLMSGKSFTGEICNKAKSGKIYWVQSTIIALVDNGGKPNAFISIRTDITESKMIAMELEETRDILSFQVSQLQEANADLDQFAYVASHDLKSPLNGISQLVSWIDEDCKDILPDESKEHLLLLKSRSKRMLNLLNDLLEYSRVGRDEHETEILNLKKLTQKLFEMQGNKKGFTCSGQDVNFELQRIPFEMVLRNLISNAIKHHDKAEGHIDISYERVEINNKEKHQFKVTDDGPGIPPELQTKAMEMFQTLQSRDEVEGSGMGLAMVKKMVEKYEGGLKIESDGARGTTFVVTWGV